MTPEQINTALNNMSELAQQETMSHFRQQVAVDNKEQGGFDPVTLADKGAERVIRAYISEHFPDHGILGEEEAPVNPDAEHCWIIDPVDGTRAFICGLPSWGTLIGLNHDGTPIAGMMHQPFTGEKYIAIGVPGAIGATGAIGASGSASQLIHNGKSTRLKTSSTNELSAATMMTTTPDLFQGENQRAFHRMQNSLQLVRYGFDCYGYCMVAAGHIDLVMECDLNPYDIAPLIPIIENAGGIVTTWDGQSAAKGGNVLASANQTLHQAALRVINSA